MIIELCLLNPSAVLPLEMLALQPTTPGKGNAPSSVQVQQNSIDFAALYQQSGEQYMALENVVLNRKLYSVSTKTMLRRFILLIANLSVSCAATAEYSLG